MNIKEVTPKPVERVFEIRCSGSELQLIYYALLEDLRGRYAVNSMRRERIEDISNSIRRSVDGSLPL